MPEEEKKEEKKDKKDEDKVVLKVHMHCEACRDKVKKAMMGFPGIEKIDIDMKEQKVTLKGKIDAKKLFERVKKKSGNRAIQILYPEPKKDDGKKDEKKDGDKKKEEKKKEPVDVTVVLKVHMHCEGCAKKVKKAAEKIPGVYDVKVDLSGGKVTVKGKDIDPKKVCEAVSKKIGWNAEIVPKKEEKKDEKKEEKKDDKKEEKKEEKKDGDKKDDSKKSETKPSKSVTEYVYPPQLFSDENPNACSIM